MINAYLLNEPQLMQHRILLRQRTASGFWYWDGNAWQTLEEGTIPPGPDGLILPSGSVEQVAEAFHPFAGGEREISRLEDALAREQYCVDRVLDKILESS